MAGFIQIEVSRRRRGRPDRLRRVEVVLRDGTRLGFSAGSPPDLVRAIVTVVLGRRGRRC